MTKALITGERGFLGQHLVKYLSEKTDWHISSTHVDLTDPLPDLGEFDYIINLASNSSVEESIQDPVNVIKNNVAITTNVLEYARQHPPKVFLQFSTIEVYNVTSPYAASKAAQEAIANAYWKTYDVPVVIARSSNIVGEGQSPDKFVPKIIEQIRNEETVTLYTSNGKQGERIYNTVLNVADALLFLLLKYPQLTQEKRFKETGFPIDFDINSGENLTNLQMAEKIARLLGKPLKYETIEPTATRPTYARNLFMSGAELTLLDWRPPETLDEGMAWIR